MNINKIIEDIFFTILEDSDMPQLYPDQKERANVILEELKLKYKDMEVEK